MTKDSNTTAKGYKNAVQSIGYAAAYPAYPLNAPLCVNNIHAAFYTCPSFYRAMHFSAKRGIAIACRLSVRLSVCL